MISFVILLSCFLLRAQSLEEYCAAIGPTDCDYEFLCLWDGGTGCDADENADLSYTFIDCGDKTGCVNGTYSYYNGATNVNVYYTHSDVKAFNDIDKCSVDYAISIDLDDNAYCDTTNCGLVPYGSVNVCFDYCFAVPAACNPGTTTCPYNTGDQCCATVSSTYCADYCGQNHGTQEQCCGGPSTHASLSTNACANYMTFHTGGTDHVNYDTCGLQPSNLTACAMCTTYYQCCTQFKTKATTLSAAICDHFCGLKPADADCEKRKKCLESLGHPPSEAELAKCGTSIVRLSSFTVAVLLGVVAFFFLV